MSDDKSHTAEAESPRPVALVTGGAVRLGRAIALALAEAGHDLAISYRSSRDEAVRTCQEIRDHGVLCHRVCADLSTAEGPGDVVAATRERFGRLDVVVNSAASFRSLPLSDVDASEWDDVMALNVRGPHLLVRAAADLLTASEGSVVNITDLSAFHPWVSYPHHSVSKAALAHLTRVQARAYGPAVRVNAIAPGAVLAPDDWSAGRWERRAERAALKKTGDPQDVVEAVLYLVGADFVTGQVLVVDGGRLLGPPESSEDEG
ncbi:MAG: SDR family oxidoreductase [Longimicrobiales bacterium]|nr:SDR family oxidoreductase [Longimicrobiales bacterium]